MRCNCYKLTKCTAQQWSVFPFFLYFFVVCVYTVSVLNIVCFFSKGPCARCVVEIVLKLESEHCRYFVFIVLYCLLQHTFQNLAQSTAHVSPCCQFSTWTGFHQACPSRRGILFLFSCQTELQGWVWSCRKYAYSFSKSLNEKSDATYDRTLNLKLPPAAGEISLKTSHVASLCAKLSGYPPYRRRLVSIFSSNTNKCISQKVYLFP